jgi:asparaginyl-tRNA synthetase
LSVGSSFEFRGILVKSPAKGQLFELAVRDNASHYVRIFGKCDQGKYPLAKKNHSVEYLREVAHLRPRTNLIGSVTRVRHSLAIATHDFFQQKGFRYIHTPIITGSDCEGAGEMFQVTTILPEPSKPIDEIPVEKGKRTVDYHEDFFKAPTFLTVSGQLNVENFCVGMGDVYTFGPTFRAENSHTSRHLAEFWMIEPEIAFADLYDDMHLAEEYLKFCLSYVLENNQEDLDFFDQRVEKGIKDRLKNVIENEFKRLTYTEAVDELIKVSKKANFEKKVEWGIDLGTEHERYLTEKIYKKPVIVYDYPKDFKAFYMRLNDDNKTVAAMDILAPKIGEIIGGAQREERFDVLTNRMKEAGLDPVTYSWYLDLRRYGSVPHCGFGLGFERLVMMATGIENIRDVIPFPRWPGHSEF